MSDYIDKDELKDIFRNIIEYIYNHTMNEDDYDYIYNKIEEL